jgi:hypothetical protein
MIFTRLLAGAFDTEGRWGLAHVMVAVGCVPFFQSLPPVLTYQNIYEGRQPYSNEAII